MRFFSFLGTLNGLLNLIKRVEKLEANMVTRAELNERIDELTVAIAAEHEAVNELLERIEELELEEDFTDEVAKLQAAKTKVESFVVEATPVDPTTPTPVDPESQALD